MGHGVGHGDWSGLKWVFGCDRCFWLWLWFLVVFGVGPVFLVVVVVFVLKGVVGHGWVWGLGCGWVVGPMFGSWVMAWVWWLWFLAVTGVFGCGFWLWLCFLVFGCYWRGSGVFGCGCGFCA